MQLRNGLWAASLFITFNTPSFGSAELNFESVRELHKNSTHQGMAFVAGQLFISDMDKDYNHQVNIYDASGKNLLDTIAIDHSVTGLYPLGDRGVIAIGRKSAPHWSSHLTYILKTKSRYTSTHVNLGNQVMVESAVSDGQNIYFNEKGSRGIYRMAYGGRRLQKLPIEVSGPGINMKLSGGKLYIVELRDLFSPGDESIVEFDLQANKGRRLASSEQLFGLKNLSVIGNDVIGVEKEGNAAVVVDSKTNQLIGRVRLDVGAYGIASYGKCAVIVSDESKMMSFVRRSGNEVNLIAKWDLSVAGDRLKQPRTLAVDSSTGAVFVRSNYHCNSCNATQSSVFRFDDQGAALASCL